MVVLDVAIMHKDNTRTGDDMLLENQNDNYGYRKVYEVESKSAMADLFDDKFESWARAVWRLIGHRLSQAKKEFIEQSIKQQRNDFIDGLIEVDEQTKG